MNELSPFLNSLFERYHRSHFLSSDPLEFPRRFSDPWDQEAAALISALLAYGNVKQIRRSVEDLLSRLGSSPAAFVRALASREGRLRGHTALRGFVHRFNRGEDFLLLLSLLQRSWDGHGSLGGHLLSRLEPGAPDFALALDGLIADWREWAGKPGKNASFSHLLTAPRDGSCCKRWCMLLRWMGRTDSRSSQRLDLGLWNQGSPLAGTFPKGRWLRESQLVIPLDTHTGRISQYLGLTNRKTLGWTAAVEITDALRACDAYDPVRYDFALARLGILDLCRRKYRAEICPRCELISVCRLAAAYHFAS